MTEILLSVDLKTLLLLTVLNFLASGFLLIFIFRIRHRSFIKLLAFGCFIFALGWLLFLCRFAYSINLITLPLANIFILSMPILLRFSVDSFLDKKYLKPEFIITVFVFILTFFFLAWSMNHKWIPGIYTSIVNAIFYSILAIHILKVATRKNIIIWVIIGLNLLISLLLIIRFFVLLYAWFYSDNISETIVTGFLMLSLSVNIVCINAQVLYFPILDMIEAQKDLILVNRELEELSNIDDLTGLPNRRALRVKLDHEVAYHADRKLPFSIILLDIDHFKSINDKFGHLVGDRVLKEIANLLRKLVRQSDIAMRYGGEEFIVLLPETKISEALSVAEHLRVGISQLDFVYSDIPVPLQVTASFGVSTLNKNLSNASQLVKQADLALYMAKSEGRNRVRSSLL